METRIVASIGVPAPGSTVGSAYQYWNESTVLTLAPPPTTTSFTPGCENMSSKSGRSGTGPLFVSTVSLNVELLIAGTSRPTHASGSAKLTRDVRGSPVSVVYVATAETVVDMGMHFVCT